MTLADFTALMVAIAALTGVAFNIWATRAKQGSAARSLTTADRNSNFGEAMSIIQELRHDKLDLLGQLKECQKQIDALERRNLTLVRSLSSSWRLPSEIVETRLRNDVREDYPDLPDNGNGGNGEAKGGKGHA